MIGYCPQFDLLWNELTVEEHLYFYSRLKNVNTNIIHEVNYNYKILECRQSYKRH